jgi:hypothetical protein
MRSFAVLFLIVTSAAACHHRPVLDPRVAWVDASGDSLFSYVPPAGAVPDSITAVRIAVAVWTPVYGAENIAREAPYRASLHGGVWTVGGSLPPHMQGGVAVIDIRKFDGRILRIDHGK